MKQRIVKTRIHLAIKTVLLTSPLFTPIIFATPSYAAATTTQQFNIAADSLNNVLKQIALQSGLTLAYEPKNLSSQKSAGIQGNYNIEQALETVLKPYNLEAIKLPSGGFSIQQKTVENSNVNSTKSVNTQSDDNAIQLPTMIIKAEAINQTHVGKSNQSLKEVPQSVTVMSRERIDQQGLKTLDDVLLQTTGVTREQLWLNNNYIARGLKIENIRYDGGGASSLQDRSNSADIAQYESVELLRGADGLFGAGEAGGVINLTSKRPKAETEIVGTLSGGSWNNYRGEIDVTGSLNQDQTIQGRLVTVFQDQDFFYKPTHNRREMVYGALNFDLTEDTKLFTGASYQKDRTEAFNASLPRWQDGADLHLPRSTTMGAPWSWMERENISVFTNLQYQINDDWKTQLNIRHNIGDDAINGAEMEGSVSYSTRDSVWWRYQDDTSFKETTLDLNLQGSFNLFGQKHDLILGLDHANNEKDYKQNWVSYGTGNAFDREAPPEWDYPPTDWISIGNTTNKKTGAYGSLRVRPIENVALIVGGRYAFKDDNVVHNLKTNNYTKKIQDKTFIPYYGIVYDINDQFTVYASVAEIYQNQANLLDANRKQLDPVTGTNYEIGLKSELIENRLAANIAIYQIKKEGMGALIGPRTNIGDGISCCYVASGEYESKGVDIEFNGNITPDLNISVGYTFNENENKRNAGLPFSTVTPKHLLKVWMNYKLDHIIEGLEVSGGVNAQTSSYVRGRVQEYNPVSGLYDRNNTIEITQDNYAVWSLRAAYEINSQWNLSANLNNILDKRYYSTIGSSGYGNFYGEPRSFMLTLRGKY